MDFADPSPFMGLGDFDGGVEPFAFQNPHPEAVSNTTSFSPVHPPNFSRVTTQNQDRRGHHGFTQTQPARGSRNQVQSSGSFSRQSTKVQQPSSSLSSLQTTLQRVRPLQEKYDARFRILEDQIRKLEDQNRQLDARLKSLNEAMTDIGGAFKESETKLSTVYQTGSILAAFLEKMYPQEDGVTAETE